MAEKYNLDPGWRGVPCRRELAGCAEIAEGAGDDAGPAQVSLFESFVPNISSLQLRRGALRTVLRQVQGRRHQPTACADRQGPLRHRAAAGGQSLQADSAVHGHHVLAPLPVECLQVPFV